MFSFGCENNSEKSWIESTPSHTPKVELNELTNNFFSNQNPKHLDSDLLGKPNVGFTPNNTGRVSYKTLEFIVSGI